MRIERRKLSKSKSLVNFCILISISFLLIGSPDTITNGQNEESSNDVRDKTEILMEPASAGIYGVPTIIQTYQAPGTCSCILYSCKTLGPYYNSKISGTRGYSNIRYGY